MKSNFILVKLSGTTKQIKIEKRQFEKYNKLQQTLATQLNSTCTNIIDGLSRINNIKDPL